MAKDKGSFGQNAGKPGVVYILCEMVDHHKMGKRKTDLYKIGESTQGGKVRAKRLTDDAKDEGSNVYYEFITETATLDCYGAEQLVFKKLKEFRQGDFWEDGGHEFFKFNNEQQVQNAIKVIRETCAEVDDNLNQEKHKRQESKKTETERPRKFRTHYDNLKIARNAPDALIKAAYKVLLQQHHPDKVEVAKQAEALRITHIIRGAYEVLSDPVQRAEHDAWIKIQEIQSRNHKPEQPDINVNEACEKEESRRREAEKEEAKKQHQATKNEELRREREERKTHEAKAKNKTGCLPWIIGVWVIYFLIMVAGKNNQTTVPNPSYQAPTAPATYVQPAPAYKPPPTIYVQPAPVYKPPPATYVQPADSYLIGEQAQQVKRAENNENLKMCLNGKYPSLCRHGDLNSEQAQQVQRAENNENLKMCLNGKYPSLCRHGDLNGEQAQQVQRAEDNENLKMCLNGKYPVYADMEILMVNKRNKFNRQNIMRT